MHIVVKYSIHTCHVPSTADTGCSIIGSTRSTTVEYRTDSRLLHTFIGLNHVIRLANLLQHLWWKLKGMHDLSKLRKQAKLQIWQQKNTTNNCDLRLILALGMNSKLQKKTLKDSYKTPLCSRENSLKLKCSCEKRPNILLWRKGN